MGANQSLEGRHLFDSDMAIRLKGGDSFVVSDLCEFDLFSITNSYDRRMNGDIGIMGSTGRTSQELLKDVAQVKTPQKKKRDALTERIRILTGCARLTPEGSMTTMARSAMDFTFVTKNAYMTPMTFAEAAGLIVKDHTHMLLKGVPLVLPLLSRLKPETARTVFRALVLMWV